jgi:hypothetical protein
LAIPCISPSNQLSNGMNEMSAPPGKNGREGELYRVSIQKTQAMGAENAAYELRVDENDALTLRELASGSQTPELALDMKL